MFCPGCGAELQIDGAFCHKCGRQQYDRQVRSTDSSAFDSSKISRAGTDAKNKKELIAKIRQGAPDLNSCQICSTSAKLNCIEFGLGKLKTGRKWGETVTSVLASAVSLPVFGVGGVVLPTKKSDMKVIRLRLVLCTRCLTAKPDFTAHPWFQNLWEAGYNQFVPPERLGLFLQ